MSWAYIESDNNIQEFTKLPENWKNISNFYALESDKETLKQFGWYKLIDQTIPISNDLYEYHDAPQYKIDVVTGTVYKNCPIIQKENALNANDILDENHKNFMFLLRNMRNTLLTDCDWTQLADIQAIKSEEWILAWKQYRQDLRDLPEYYENTLIVDVNLVTWPVIPGN